MKITRIEPLVVGAPTPGTGRLSNKNYIFVRVHTDEGITGLGEASLGGYTQTIVSLLGDLEELLIGEDPTRIEYLAQVMTRQKFWRGGVVKGSAVAGVELALWDILGKSLGVPVYRLFGGPYRQKIRVYVNGWTGGSLEPAVIHDRAQEALAAGYDAFKFSIALPSWPLRDPAVIRTIATAAETIREAIGPERLLMFDGHGRYDADSAIAIGHALEPYSLYFFEEPVSQLDVEAMARVARALPMPIAAGERLESRWEFRRLLENGAVSVVQPDLAHCNGFLEAYKIAALADAARSDESGADGDLRPPRRGRTELPHPGAAFSQRLAERGHHRTASGEGGVPRPAAEARLGHRTQRGALPESSEDQHSSAPPLPRGRRGQRLVGGFIMKLNGKTVLITGGSQGLGAAMSRLFAEAGALVFVNCAHHIEKAEAVVSAIRAAGGLASVKRFDISREEEVHKAFTEIEQESGGVDILVCNARVDPYKRPPELSDGDWFDTVIGVNLKGPYLCGLAALEQMKKRGGGRIVNISSVWAYRSAKRSMVEYALSKAALHSLTRSLAGLGAAHGVTVNAVAPGMILSDELAGRLTPEEISAMTERIPVKRGAAAEEIFAAVRFVVENPYMTGEILNINGGVYMP